MENSFGEKNINIKEINELKEKLENNKSDIEFMLKFYRSQNMENKWIKEAREIAAQCWCDEETEHKEMDVELAEAMAKRISYWMEVAAQYSRNQEYYRNLVIQCGEYIGHESYVQDDGGICEDVLCAKVPELVKKLVEEHNEKKN